MALHQRNGRAAVLEHHFAGLVVHGVRLGVAADAGDAARAFRAVAIQAALEQAFDVVRLALGLQALDHAVDFIVADKGAVHAHRQAGARRHVEHVALAQQGFRAHLVENGARVDLGRDLKGDAGRDVGLDQAGNHVHAGALGGQDQVDASGARLLRQARDQFFDLLAHHHHQVGQLVDDHHDGGQRRQRLGLVGRQRERIGDGFLALDGVADLGVVAGQVAHAHLAHQAVALFHFAHAPVQRVAGLAHVRDHRRQQVRNAFVDAHFEHLRIDQDQTGVRGVGLVQERQDHGVDPDRLAGAGGAGHQQVRHLGQVGHHRIAGDVLAQRHRHHRVAGVVGLRTQDFRQLDHLAARVGQFQAHQVLAGYGFHHPYADQAERARQVLGQVDDLATLDASGRLDFVARDDRARLRRHHGDGHAEVGQLLSIRREVNSMVSADTVSWLGGGGSSRLMAGRSPSAPGGGAKNSDCCFSFPRART